MLASEPTPQVFDESAPATLMGVANGLTAAADRTESSDYHDEPLERASSFLARAGRAFASMQLDLAAHADERASLRRLVAAMSTTLLGSARTPRATVRADAAATDVSLTADVHESQNMSLRKRVDELDELVASLLHQLSAHCSLDLEEALTNERLAHAETQRLLVASHSDNERLRDAVRALQADLFAAHTTALSMPSSSVDLSTFNPTTNALESHAALVGTADSATSDVAAKSRVAPLTPSSKSVSSAMAAHLLTPPSRVIGAPLFGTPAFLEPDDLAVANAGVMTPVSADAPMKESAASALLTVERDGIDSSHTTSLTNAVVPIRHEFSDIHVSAAFASAASTRMGLVQSDDGYLLSSSLAPTLKPEQIEITDVRQNSPIPSYASSAEASSVPSQLSAYESTANLMSFVSSLFALKSGQRPALVDSEYSVHRRVADEWSECADLAIDGCDLSMHSAASSLGLEGLQLQPDSARQLPDDEVSNPLLNRDIAIEPPPQWHVDESDPSFDALGLVPPISPAALFVASASSASPLLTSPAPSAPASGDHSEANDRMLEGTIESAQSISAQSMSSLAETISSSSSILILSDISSISISPRSGDEFWALQPGTPMNHSSASSCLSSSSRVSLGKSAVASPAAAGVWVPGASVAAIPEGDESAHMRSPHQSLASAPPASSSASSSSSAAPVPPASSLFPPISMSMLSVSSTSASTSALRTVDVIPPRLSLSARNWQPYVAPSLPDSAASSSSSSSSSSLSAHASSTSATSSSTAMRAGRQPLAPVNPRRDVAVSGNADDDGFLSSFVRMVKNSFADPSDQIAAAPRKLVIKKRAEGKENIPPKELPPATDAVLSPGRAVAASGKAPARFDVAIDPSSKIASSSSSVHAAKRAAYNAMIPGPMFTGRPVAPVSSAPARAKTFLR